MLSRVCVFCGSNKGIRDSYATATRALVQVLAERNIGLVYGGGNIGLMGLLADAALETGVEVIGVIPRFLVEKEVAHKNLTEMRVVGSMHERKALMADLSDAFVALPGGFGTFDEFCEILTWAQLGLHHKPCGILNANGYFDYFLKMLDHAEDEEFLKPEHRRMVLSAADSSELLDRLQIYQPPGTGAKWITSDQV